MAGRHDNLWSSKPPIRGRSIQEGLEHLEETLESRVSELEHRKTEELQSSDLIQQQEPSSEVEEGLHADNLRREELSRRVEHLEALAELETRVVELEAKDSENQQTKLEEFVASDERQFLIKIFLAFLVMLFSAILAHVLQIRSHQWAEQRAGSQSTIERIQNEAVDLDQEIRHLAEQAGLWEVTSADVPVFDYFPPIRRRLEHQKRLISRLQSRYKWNMEELLGLQTSCSKAVEGLHNCLTEEFTKRPKDKPMCVSPVESCSRLIEATFFVETPELLP